MSAKKSASVLASGLGMGMALLQTLVEEVEAAGGCEEMLHFLTREQGRPLCTEIAALIVKRPWQIPRSLIERLAMQFSIDNFNTLADVQFDKRWNWLPVLFMAGGLPPTIVCFRDEDMVSEHPDYIPLPPEVKEQIVGKPATYPMIVTWQGEPHVVVQIELKNRPTNFVEGDIIRARIEVLDIVPTRFFNLEQ